MKFVDRTTFHLVMRYFFASASIDGITKFYIDSFKKDGWNYLGSLKQSDHSSQFCKHGMLGTIGFIDNSANGETTYVLTITTGGTAIRTCGG